MVAVDRYAALGNRADNLVQRIDYRGEPRVFQQGTFALQFGNQLCHAGRFIGGELRPHFTRADQHLSEFFYNGGVDSIHIGHVGFQIELILQLSNARGRIGVSSCHQMEHSRQKIVVYAARTIDDLVQFRIDFAQDPFCQVIKLIVLAQNVERSDGGFKEDPVPNVGIFWFNTYQGLTQNTILGGVVFLEQLNEARLVGRAVIPNSVCKCFHRQGGWAVCTDVFRGERHK